MTFYQFDRKQLSSSFFLFFSEIIIRVVSGLSDKVYNFIER